MKSDAVQSKRDVMRDNIIVVSQDIFKRYGYKKTTLDDIAIAVGKGKSSLYYYFSSKEDLFLAVIEKEGDVLRSELSKVLAKNIDPEDKLREYILTKISTYRELANFYNVMESDSIAIGFIEELKANYYLEEIRMMKRILLEGARRGKFYIQDFTLSSIGITTAIKGLEMPLVMGKSKGVELMKSVDAILSIICYGIMKR